MSSAFKSLRPSLTVCGTRQKLRLSKQARFLPTTAHTALALDSATGSGQVRVRCHSLRQSTSHNVTFSASGKFHLCLGFSSPRKAGFAGTPSSPPPAALPLFPGFSPSVRFRFHLHTKKQIPQKGYLFFGAGNRNRTGTDFTPRDFLTTIAFATRLVCGLDHAFTCSRWSVSGLYTFQGASLAWLGVATIKGFTEFTDIQNSHPWLSALFFDR